MMSLNRKRKQLIAAALAVTLVLGSVTSVSVANAPSVSAAQADTETLDLYGSAPSQEEIKKAFQKYRYEKVINAKVTYAEQPVVSPAKSLKAGRLSNDTIKDTLDMINLVRYIASLDEVTDNEEYNECAQSAAVYLAHLGGDLDHHPKQVNGVSDEFYEKAKTLGTAKSNLSAHSIKDTNVAQRVISLMRDSSSQWNRWTVGHRAWLLDSVLSQRGVGIGFANSSGKYKSYAAIRVIGDEGMTGGEQDEIYRHDVAWPAPNMPLELFKEGDPWSVSLNRSSYYNKSNWNTAWKDLQVTLVNRKTKKTWKCTKTDDSNNGKGHCHINFGYGQYPVVIFEPENISYADGDIFDVKIEGLTDVNDNPKTLEYTVNFFQAVKGTSTPTTSQKPSTPTTPTTSKDDGEDDNIQYEVSFDANGGKGTLPRASVSSKNRVTLPSAGSLTRSGYTFDGWESSEDGKVYPAGRTLTLTEDTTFTAQWKRNVRYSATFAANGATGTLPKVSVSEQNRVTLPAATSLTRSGYTFQGWKSSADNKTYSAGQSVLLTQNTTFTAQWSVSAPITPTTPSQTTQLKLDTVSVMMQPLKHYTFMVRNNNDVANLAVTSDNPKVATVSIQNANDSRGALYRISSTESGIANINVYYKGQHSQIKVTVGQTSNPTPTNPSNTTATNPGKGSIMLDTANYIMSPGNVYDIGVTIKDPSGKTLGGAEVQALHKAGKLKVTDSRTGSVAKLTQLSNGNFRVTGKNPGTCYIVYDIGGNHASVKIDVKRGEKQHGTAVRNTSYFTSDVFPSAK